MISFTKLDVAEKRVGKLMMRSMKTNQCKKKN